MLSSVTLVRSHSYQSNQTLASWIGKREVSCMYGPSGDTRYIHSGYGGDSVCTKFRLLSMTYLAVISNFVPPRTWLGFVRVHDGFGGCAPLG